MFVAVLGMLLLFTARADETDGKYALVLGAGGEPPGATTIFDPSFKILGEKLEDNGYRTTGAVDGGHQKTEQIVKDGFGPEVKGFTKQNADEQIARLAETIGSGKAKQLLIVVNTHGWPATAKALHLVGTADPESPTYDLAQLEKLQAKAREHGVKLAILDMSCYSGQTLALNKRYPETCVVTGAGSNNVGYSDVSASLFKNLRRGRSLEDSYRDTRRGAMSGWPQISTPAGYAAGRALADLHGPVSGYEGDTQAHDMGQLNLKRCAAIVRNQFDTLRSITRAMPDINPKLLERLTRRTEAYYAARNAAAGDNEYRLKSYTLSGGFQINQHTLTTLDAAIKMAKTFAAQNPADWTKSRDDLLAHEAEARELIAKLEKRDPRFAAEVQRSKAAATPASTTGDYFYTYPAQDSADLPPTVTQLANDVASTEREIYDSIYENESKKPSATKDANPCRDFKF